MKKLENSFAVTGFIGKDAEIRSFQTASVARFSIAISRAEKEGEETTYVSSFMGVEAWRKNEALDSFDVLKKGNLVTVEGYFKPEEWTDAESGAKRSRIVMVATKFYLAPEKEEEKPAPKQEEKIFQIGEAASAAFLFAPHPDWFCVHADGPTRPFSGMFPLLAAVGYKWPTDRQEKHLVHPISFLE